MRQRDIRRRGSAPLIRDEATSPAEPVVKNAETLNLLGMAKGIADIYWFVLAWAGLILTVSIVAGTRFFLDA